jgi:hypothetical protein
MAAIVEAAALGQIGDGRLEQLRLRHGSVKRVASAVGDGSIAIRLAYDYLA